MDILVTLTTYLPLARVVHDGWGGWWWLGGPLMFLLWFLLIFLIVRFVFRPRWWGYREQTPADRGRAILAERFARGEIDGAEYRQRLQELESLGR